MIHKSKELNNIIAAKNCEYINVNGKLIIEGRLIVAGPCYHTSVLSQMLHITMEPTLSFIKNILKDSFDLTDRIIKECASNTMLSTCDIKSQQLNVGLIYLITLFHYFNDFLKHLF